MTYGPLQAAVADSVKHQDELIAKITVSPIVTINIKHPQNQKIAIGNNLNFLNTDFYFVVEKSQIEF